MIPLGNESRLSCVPQKQMTLPRKWNAKLQKNIHTDIRKAAENVMET
jgi:hypothetical protein